VRRAAKFGAAKMQRQNDIESLSIQNKYLLQRAIRFTSPQMKSIAALFGGVTTKYRPKPSRRG
jgi:hypothetical protein